MPQIPEMDDPIKNYPANPWERRGFWRTYGVLLFALLIILLIQLPRIPENIAYYRLKDVTSALRATADALNRYHQQQGRYPIADTSLTPQRLPTDLGGDIGEDAFQKGKYSRFAYAASGETSVLISIGPDRSWQLDPLEVLQQMESVTEIENFRYDPTNGMFSTGDIFLLTGKP